MLSNLKIRSRLIAGFGVVLCFLVLIGGFSLKNLAAQGRLLTEFYEHPFTVTNAIQEVQEQIVRMHRSMKDVVLYGGDRQELESALRQGKLSEATVYHKEFARHLVARIDAEVDQVVKFSAGKAQSFVKEAQQTQRWTFTVSAVLSVCALLLALITTAFITASIVGPLKEAVDAADRLALGELDVEIRSDAQDEIGQLLRAMETMVGSLRAMGESANRIALGDLDVEVRPSSERDVFGVAMRNMVASLKRLAASADRIAAGDLTLDVLPASPKDQLGTSFQAMARNLRELNLEIGEVVNVLAASASEIMTTVSELASSSAETASSVSETNATVQEVRQTTDLTSQKSRQVYDSASRSVQVAKNGQLAVEDAIGGMRGIDERMGFIAERIVNLSEQSQAIGDIIATVNDLAEQSNLLAVNAAIEAAKAGEHGKGFAVVAQEVKNLATQSKQATAQVRGILGVIQKATTAAVLATEQGSKAVEAGVKQSGSAGEAIRQLAASIEDSSNATLQIVTSTQEQAIGMDQIAIAVQSINQASSQNLEGSRQIEMAARNLYELNQKLQQLVSRYRVA